MKKLLDEKMKRKNVKDMIDGFSTEHLKTLFNDCTEDETAENLEVTQELFKKHLRNEVMTSSQIKGDSQRQLYLNTLKCSSLRFSSKILAQRLQLS